MVVSTSWLKIPEKVIELSTGDSGFASMESNSLLEPKRPEGTDITDIHTNTDIPDITDVTEIF